MNKRNTFPNLTGLILVAIVVLILLFFKIDVIQK